MASATKTYFIKGDPAIEILAMNLYNDSAEYASGWAEVSEQTRNRFRKMARGEVPLAYRGPRPDDDEREVED